MLDRETEGTRRSSKPLATTSEATSLQGQAVGTCKHREGGVEREDYFELISSGALEGLGFCLFTPPLQKYSLTA